LTASPNATVLPGQRWASDSEPEVGLGVILSVGFREVVIEFRAAGETRTYMRRNAPLRRVLLQPGDRARTRSGESFVVTRVETKDGILHYWGAGQGEGASEAATAGS
jgi:ATP-dependent helicase HepA